MGPMSEVVLNSTQHLSDVRPGGDGDLPAGAAAARGRRAASAVPLASARGATLYQDHCVACHGERGEGVPGAYPALARAGR
jgi:mono/diheme cytochrome c family protein